MKNYEIISLYSYFLKKNKTEREHWQPENIVIHDTIYCIIFIIGVACTHNNELSTTRFIGFMVFVYIMYVVFFKHLPDNITKVTFETTDKEKYTSLITGDFEKIFTKDGNPINGTTQQSQPTVDKLDIK